MPPYTKSFSALLSAAAVFLLAGSALAQNVTVEDMNGEPCSEVTFESPHDPDDGCILHIASTSGSTGSHVNLLQHITGVGEVLRLNCRNEYTAHIGPDGEGWLEEIVILPEVGSLCTPRACTEEPTAEQDPWHILIQEDAPYSEHALIDLCLRLQVSANTACEVEGTIEFDVVGEAGNYAFEAVDKSISGLMLDGVHTTQSPAHGNAECNGFLGLGPLEVSGHWLIEQAQQQVQIHH